MDDKPNAGTESPAGETHEAENSHDPSTSAQTTPPAPDPAELLAQLGAEELRKIPAIQKLLDDQAAGIKAKYKPKAKQAKQEPTTAQASTDAGTDFEGALGGLMERFSEHLNGALEPLQQEIRELKSSQHADRFDAEFAKSGLPAGLKQDLKDLAAFRKVPPSELPKFLSDQRKKHLPGDGDKPLSEGNQRVSPQPPQGKPTPGSTPNGGAQDFGGVINPFTMSAEDVARASQDGSLIDIANRWRNRGLSRRRPGKGAT